MKHEFIIVIVDFESILLQNNISQLINKTKKETRV